MTILLLEPLHPQASSLLAAHDEVVLDARASRSGRDAVVAILTRGHGRISAALIDACPWLQVVARCGAGVDTINIAATRRSIPVLYASGSTTGAVAEHTLLLPVTRAAQAGAWQVRGGYRGAELGGKTLGVLAWGRSASMVRRWRPPLVCRGSAGTTPGGHCPGHTSSCRQCSGQLIL